MISACSYLSSCKVKKSGKQVKFTKGVEKKLRNEQNPALDIYVLHVQMRYVNGNHSVKHNIIMITCCPAICDVIQGYLHALNIHNIM